MQEHEIKPKKFLGQHFLHNGRIAHDIVQALDKNVRTIIEVGPGKGALTKFLVQDLQIPLYLVEIDARLTTYLAERYPQLQGKIITSDFLSLDFTKLCEAPIAIIGNFPYNISSQIFFKLLDTRAYVNELVGMVQQEVASRIVAKPHCKTYGILSVLLQAFYHVEYLFTVSSNEFIPPPNVQSAVIKLRRNQTAQLNCDEALFFKVVKTSFQHRRKTLRNALASLLMKKDDAFSLLNNRAEQLSVKDFVALTSYIEQKIKVGRVG